MKYSFSELKAYFASKRGATTFAALDANLKVAAIADINSLYNKIWYFKGGWGFNGRHFQGTFVAPVTGTCSGTSGQRVVTLGASVNASYNGVMTVGQFIHINSTLYRLVYRRSATVWTIDRPLLADVATGTAYTIYFVNYPCPYDFGMARGANRGTEDLYYVNEYLTPLDQGAGIPDFIYNAGRTETDFVNTGTVTSVNASNRLTYSTTVSVEWIGMSLLLMVSNAYEFFRIVDVDTGSNYIFLDRAFTGTGASGISIKINPAGLQQIGFKNFPLSADAFDVWYTFAPNKLQYDTDMTLLPTDGPMLEGIKVLGVAWQTVGEGNMNEVVFQNKEFKESLKSLSMRGMPLQDRLHTAAEAQRLRRFPRNTNPWNSGNW